MNKLRVWLSCLMEPPFRLFCYSLWRWSRQSRMRIGTLTFWGPRDFLKSCAASVQQLKELDSDFYNRLTTQQKLVFCYNPKDTPVAYFVWIITISDRYLAWKTEGIITLIVYSSFLAAQYPKRKFQSNAANQMLNSYVNQQTHSWLTTHNFPEPLIDCFSENPK